MSFEDYANHISKKLKLAVSMAIIRSVPENLTTEEYINQLKSNIKDQKDSDSEISVCSDDFELDDNNSDHNLINNNNISDNNNHSDNIADNNTYLSDNRNEILINNSKSHNTNNVIDNNCTRDNEINNIHFTNDKIAIKDTRNEENKTNGIENDSIEANEGEDDELITNHNMSLENDDYDNLIDKVLQDDSQAILNDFCVDVLVSTDIEDKYINIHNDKEVTAEDTSNATIPINNITETLDLNDETYYQSIKDINTEKITKLHEIIPNSDTKVNKDTTSITIDGTNTKKQKNKIKDGPSAKRRRNMNNDPKSQTEKHIKDPNLRIKNNISKFLDENNIASKAKPTTENVKENDSLDSINKNNTQTNTYYSQSQPLFVIDQKYMYDKSKSTPIIKENLKQTTEVSKKDVSVSSHDTNVNNKDKHHDITVKTPIIKDTALKVPNYSTNTMKIIENDTALHHEREIYLFSQTSVCDLNNDDKLTKDAMKENRNNSNNKINVTIIEDNHCNNKEQTNAAKYNTNNNSNTNTEEIQSTLDLTQETSLLSEQNNNKNTTQSSIYSIGFQLSPIHQSNNNRNIDHNHRNNNNETIQSTVDLFSQELQQNNYHRNNDNNNRNNRDNNHNNETIQSTVDLFSQELQQNNYHRNNDNNNRNNRDNNHYNETTQTSVDLLSQENNNNRKQDNNNRNEINNNNETDLTQNTLKNLPIGNVNDEIINLSRNSESDSTDSDEIETEEVIPFKIVEELNKIKLYLNRIERGTDSSSDTGYRSDSQSRHSMKMSQSNVWLNQSAHSLFIYVTTCPLTPNTQEITREISEVLAQLIQKIYEDESYLSFMEEILDTVDLLLHSILDEKSEQNELLKKDETTQRILFLNKSIHIQKYTIEKITKILEKIHTNLTKKDSLYEIENIQKIENTCYIFHILQIILQKYYKNKENLTKKLNSSQKSQFDSQKSQHSSQKSQHSSQKSQSLTQKSQMSSLNSQEVLKKTDLSDIWRKKWNPNFKEITNEDNFEIKCPLTDCSKVLNRLIVSCMDGYSLIAYFALKCFNLMQP